jgi:hypothetical protein
VLVKVEARSWFEPHRQDIAAILDHGDRVIHPELSV